jgi:hypothetical protein
VWAPARWVPVGAKASFVLGQRFIGANPPPAWRVTTWQSGAASTVPPPPPGAQLGNPSSLPPAPSAFAPSSAPVLTTETNIVDWYLDAAGGLFYAWAWQQPGNHLVFEDADNPAGPWTERAFWSCSDQSLLFVANFNGSMKQRYVRARNVPCSAVPSLAATDARMGVNIIIPTRSGPKAVIQVMSSAMRLSPGWTLYTAAHP